MSRYDIAAVVCIMGISAFSIWATFTIRAQYEELEVLRARECAEPFLTVSR